MQLKYMTIEFDHPDKVYVSGSKLSGVFKVGFDKSATVKCINIFIKGKGKAHWKKDEGNDTIHYRGYEYYIQETINVYEAKDEKEEHPGGDFSYPFSFELDKDLPSSFEGKKGYVRYTVTAFVERWSFFKTDKGLREPFTIIHHLDCNSLPNALTPIFENEEQKVEGFCCCKCSEQGAMTVKLNINKTAFVPGEPLVYDINIDNRSQNLIKEMEFILRQNVTYAGFSDRILSSGKPHYKTKKYAFKLADEKINIPVNQNQTYKGAATIPALPPSNLEGCNIIDIQYNIILVVQNSWTPIKIKREVIIGTIPTNEEYQTPAPPPDMGISSADIGFSLQPAAPIGLPPSYAECVFGKTEIKSEDDDDKNADANIWAPSYTYYDWSKQTNYGGPAPSAVTQTTSKYDDF